MISEVLTVCIGNICRSPMVAGLLSNAMPSLNVESAGIGALIGHKADPMAVELAAAVGVDISHHIAKPLTTLLCQKSDIILVMDLEQKRYIESRYPFARGKVFRIAEGAKLDVPDPYRKEKSAFEYAFSIIEGGVLEWSERINKMNKQERKFK